MKIALLQLNPIVGDLAGNSRRIAAAVEQARQQGAALCVTPEMALLGYPPKDLLFKRSFIDAVGRTAGSLAVQLKDSIPLVLGMVAPNLTKKGRPLYNAAALLKDGKVARYFHKSLLPTHDVFDEARYFEPALTPGILEYNGVRFGVTICEDVWNDVDFGPRQRYHKNPLALLQEQGVDGIINLSASPFSIGKQKKREAMLSGLAKKYKTPFIYANQVGANDDLVFDGRSCVFNREGVLSAKGKPFQDDLVVFDLGQGTGTIAEDDWTKEAEAWNALVLGTRDYVYKCGFSQVLLGLSGGIDSSLTAAIAVEALGADKVLGVLMPSPYSSKGSVDDAVLLARNLGIKTIELPIQGIMSAFETTLRPAFSGYAPDITEENIQARIRGNLLMALSNKYKAMLLSTGNKSELAVGYCTIYGDMSGGYAVISDVPKTLVYGMAAWLNTLKNREIIPAAVLTKAPSAELRPNQTDQDSLPDYAVLDAMLEQCVEQHKSAADIIALGFDEAVVRRVLTLVANAEFKREQAAPGIKITDRAFGTGWRMPIAGKPNL
ncbi:MAG: NAD+ synthase [Candidatus Omnitrophica bacterium]|nr:NAD+ synthase [Candidatus Omnitrophota bacterium]